MNDLKTAIILAAGSSRRMGDLTATRPKSLLLYRNETILGRLLRQLHQVGIERTLLVIGYHEETMRRFAQEQDLPAMSVELVANPRFAEDTNIASMQLALERATGAVAIFEADTIMEDAMVAYACGADFDGKSSWFTKGPFTSNLYGGIVHSDERGVLDDVRVVPQWSPEFADYSKMTGVMRLSAEVLPRCRDLVERAARDSIKQYFFMPWCDHLQELPFVEGDARYFTFCSFNTPEEYEAVSAMEFDEDSSVTGAIEFADVAELKHIEGHDAARAKALLEKITEEGVWTKPMYVERNYNLVLDGQHRLEVARSLGLKKVPVQYFDYEDVPVWTLRKEEFVDRDTVVKRANAGDVYSYKTVKHKFPNVIGDCLVELGTLR